jgi:hypothetical protein
MTQAEVEQLLGGPPGYYGNVTGGTIAESMKKELYTSPPGSVEKIWYDDHNRFEIWFDHEGRVSFAHRRLGFERRHAPEYGGGAFQRFLRSLGL